MPYSDKRLDIPALAAFRAIVRHGKVRILDLGAGAGKSSELFRGHYEFIDAVEIYEPYITRFDLASKYRIIYRSDIRELTPEFLSGYDWLIAGDVLEHLSVEDAQELIEKSRNALCRMLIQVPFLYKQGEWEGNKHEAHLQPDLTRKVMAKRYPILTELFADDRLGIYML